MGRHSTERPGGPRRQPLYARVLRLRHIQPGGVLCFLYFEFVIALAVLLALVGFVSWWGVLVLPLTVAAMVKINDLVAGRLAAAAARNQPPPRTRDVAGDNRPVGTAATATRPPGTGARHRDSSAQGSDDMAKTGAAASSVSGATAQADSDTARTGSEATAQAAPGSTAQASSSARTGSEATAQTAPGSTARAGSVAGAANARSAEQAGSGAAAEAGSTPQMAKPDGETAAEAGPEAAADPRETATTKSGSAASVDDDSAGSTASAKPIAAAEAVPGEATEASDSSGDPDALVDYLADIQDDGVPLGSAESRRKLAGEALARETSEPSPPRRARSSRDEHA
jgi:hypothetical protein